MKIKHVFVVLVSHLVGYLYLVVVDLKEEKEKKMIT